MEDPGCLSRNSGFIIVLCTRAFPETCSILYHQALVCNTPLFSYQFRLSDCLNSIFGLHVQETRFVADNLPLHRVRIVEGIPEGLMVPADNNSVRRSRDINIGAWPFTGNRIEG